MSGSDSEQEDQSEDFTVHIYRGCILPENHRPIRTITWSQWTAENPDDYSSKQLGIIATRLLSGKSWVCFTKRLETICAPDYYQRVQFTSNPVKPKERLV